MNTVDAACIFSCDDVPFTNLSNACLIPRCFIHFYSKQYGANFYLKRSTPQFFNREAGGLWNLNHNKQQCGQDFAKGNAPDWSGGTAACFYICFMYTKGEAAALRQQFWTAFGQYMSPVLSAEAEKINWVNYKTGEKNIQFRMEADNKRAVIGIELTHKDTGIQQLYFEQFMEAKKLFESIAGPNWLWHLHTTDEYGKTVSKIYQEAQGVSVFKKEDWPALIRFFKTHITALDEFWSNAKWGFESLR